MTACAALERRRFENALAILERLGTTYPDQVRPENRHPLLLLWIDTVKTLCSVALDPAETAAERVDALLARLADDGPESPGNRARRLTDVADALRGRDAFEGRAKRAYPTTPRCA